MNRGAREKILSKLELKKDLKVWEIGPGLGAMSELIIDSGARLTAFEIDPAYCGLLEGRLGPSGLRLIAGDVMKTWEAEWNRQVPDRVLGNLPYNAASAIIASFIETSRLSALNVFTVQDEMGKRMLSSPGTKDYSSFTVLCQTSAVISDGGRLSPGSFYPAPRVHSRIISLKPAHPFGVPSNPELLRKLVRASFGSRRKTLSNNLINAVKLPGIPALEILHQAFSDENILLSRRPETVTPGEWVAVTNRITVINR